MYSFVELAFARCYNPNLSLIYAIATYISHRLKKGQTIRLTLRHTPKYARRVFAPHHSCLTYALTSVDRSKGGRGIGLWARSKKSGTFMIQF